MEEVRGSSRQSDDGSCGRDDRYEPSLSEIGAKVAREKEMPHKHKQKAEREQYEALRQITAAKDLDDHLDDEQAKQSNAGQCKPDANTSTPSRPSQPPQTPQRDPLLSVPREVMLQRIATRSTNPFGKTAQERQRILADIEAVEPLLRTTSTVEIVTTIPVTKVVDALESVAHRADGGSAGRSTRP